MHRVIRAVKDGFRADLLVNLGGLCISISMQDHGGLTCLSYR